MIKDDEAAALLKVDPRNLRLWRHRRQGPPWYQFVGTVYYERGELLEWIRGQRCDPAAIDA